MADEKKSTIGKQPDRKICEHRAKEMEQRWQSHKGKCKEIQTYIAPHRGAFENQPDKGKGIDHKVMLDEHPQICLRIMGSGLSSGLSSKARPWFKLAVQDPELMALDSVRLWLDTVQERMMGVYERSNIYDCTNNVYEEFGAFGPAAMMVLDDYDSVIRGYNFTCGEYWLSVGSDGRVNGFARRYWKTVGQLVKEFGEENVSQQVKAAYKNNNVDQWISVIHLIEENDDRMSDMADFKNMAYRSLQWEEKSGTPDFLRIGGYEEFPVVCLRGATVTTSDIYGKGCGWYALGASKMLQKLQRKKLLGVDKEVDPPMQKDAMVGEVNTLPGGITTSSASVPNAGLRQTQQVKLNLTDIELSIEKTQAKISSIFYTDLFLMLHQADSRQRTAREIVERHEEKMWMLSPLLEPIESQFLDALIDRTFFIMLRRGLIPEPPPELEGQDIKVEYISLLAQAQKMAGTTAIEQVCGFIIDLGKITPDSALKLDWEEAIESYADMVGIPVKLIRSKEAVAAIKEAIAEAEARAQQAQSGMIAAEGAKTLSEAELGKGSALDAVIAALAGKAMAQRQQPQEKQPAGAK